MATLLTLSVEAKSDVDTRRVRLLLIRRDRTLFEVIARSKEIERLDCRDTELGQLHPRSKYSGLAYACTVPDIQQS